MNIEVTTREEERRTLEAHEGCSVMELVRNGGIDEMLALCGGCCSCATCHIYVNDAYLDRLPAMTSDEDDLLNGSDHRQANSRLACQIPFKPQLDGLLIRIAPED